MISRMYVWLAPVLGFAGLTLIVGLITWQVVGGIVMVQVKVLP